MTVTSTTIIRLEVEDSPRLELDTDGGTLFFEQGISPDVTCINWPIEHAQALIDAIQQVCGIEPAPVSTMEYAGPPLTDDALYVNDAGQIAMRDEQ